MMLYIYIYYIYYYIILYYKILYYVILFYNILYYIILYYIIQSPAAFPPPCLRPPRYCRKLQLRRPTTSIFSTLRLHFVTFSSSWGRLWVPWGSILSPFWALGTPLSAPWTSPDLPWAPPEPPWTSPGLTLRPLRIPSGSKIGTLTLQSRANSTTADVLKGSPNHAKSRKITQNHAGNRPAVPLKKLYNYQTGDWQPTNIPDWQKAYALETLH